ncbi:PP2C family protein-serine/threonine phosphatase [Streptomyces carpinensis]|uniref:PP2C family protein-serine/threonine phosphatase n=1 Tax=Streptomyces carpinensis TaxID=66369 RepID=A0ABV1W526_9ACTN|nr:PP2C family protein-serine/threonine phosphatase [Streptomyces carpinensis]
MITAIIVTDVLSPADVHLGPLLIVAPALTASFAGPVLTGLVGVLTVVAMVCVGVFRGVLETQNLQSQIIAVVVISTIVTVFRYLRERHSGELAQVRRVSTAAQQAVLRPLPRRVGPLRVASFYLAAEDQALIGGDLYAVVRTEAGTRLIIGDAMGKGVTAIGDAALLLGAFREAGHRKATLCELMSYLEASVCWNLAEPTEPEQAGECFITALVVDIPDHDSTVRMINSGHLPPLLLHDGRVTQLDPGPSSPLGLSDLAEPSFEEHTFSFEAGDLLLLYTDGVTEARDAAGAFYPLTDRVGAWTGHGPHALVHSLRADLIDYVGGRLGDDAAVLAIERT